MKNKKISRREFTRNTSLVASASMMVPSLLPSVPTGFFNSRNDSVFISTDFPSGGGTVKMVNSKPLTLQVIPHNQKEGGWSQLWWHFRVGGLTPGEEITIQLDTRDSTIKGISPQINFSYDRKDWGLTNTGKMEVIDGKEFFVYTHIVKGDSVWFAYDLPYTLEHIDLLLLPLAAIDPGVEVIELCRSKGDRPVKALRFDNTENSESKYGIWLQARSHAFESGSSWVLHELTEWLLSNSPEAMALRKCAQITVVPIVDVDGVTEGRTGKMQAPYDHNRGWENKGSHWPEIRAIKSKIKELVAQNKADLFIDFHGPGNQSHPYFIMPESKDVLTPTQSKNRSKFLKTLDAKPFDDKLRATQSMSQICYSARPWKRVNKGNSTSWVTMNGTDSTIILTLEVNMNTPLSTREGYRSEGLVLGNAISKYFTEGAHIK
ncbi:hypothetical protein KUV50_01435 [Membranicola marinus]|uniref:Peptidase M14 domain-containing protein n=1 Tax=Membranihabitans marinus TaxID=1227546 RepID=A0A953HKL4_9BACT|nr:M14-type cytosolic carboxypeptidase [Membranihabitans marinus]MBY5956779.1 hypothetical protein [Membranihabitans marinus]